MEQGIALGKEQGIALGKEQGIEIGKKLGLDRVLASARKLLTSGIPKEEVKNVLGLSEDEFKLIEE